MIHSACKTTEKEYTIEYEDREYTVYAGPWTSLDTVWASQKCWFTKGTEVRISDNRGHTKTYVRE